MVDIPDDLGELASALRSSTSSAVARESLGRIPEMLPRFRLTADEIGSLGQSPFVGWEDGVMHVGLDEFRADRRAEALRLSAAPARSDQSVALQAWLEKTSADLREARADTRRRADRAFSASLGLGIVGGLVLFTGCGLAFSGILAMGIPATVGGAFSGLFSGVFAKVYARENEDLRQMVSDLGRIEEARIGLWLADHISDAKRRDEAIQVLIAQVRGQPSAVAQ